MLSEGLHSGFLCSLEEAGDWPPTMLFSVHIRKHTKIQVIDLLRMKTDMSIDLLNTTTVVVSRVVSTAIVAFRIVQLATLTVKGDR